MYQYILYVDFLCAQVFMDLQYIAQLSICFIYRRCVADMGWVPREPTGYNSTEQIVDVFSPCWKGARHEAGFAFFNLHI